MLGSGVRHPKEVTVRVLKAENLRVAPRSDHKQRKVSQKWKVVILGGKKKISSESVFAPDGNPVWDFETTLKIATRGDPVVLLVSDSEDNHAGQVVVPGVSIPPKPTDSSISPTTVLDYVLWMSSKQRKQKSEYRSEDSKSRSSKGSVLSLSSLHLHKDKGSTPNSLNYSGSVISLSSTHGDSKEKKPWYKKKTSQALHAAAALSYTRNGYNPFDYYHQNLHEDDGMIEERDGSVLGAYSELTSSDLNPMTNHSVRYSNEKPVNPLSLLSTISHSKNLDYPTSLEQSNNLSSNVTDSCKNSSDSLKSKPELIRIAPKCGPSSGGTELTVYCHNLTNETMQEASVFVSDQQVPRQDWFFQESNQPDRSQLRIHMPSLPSGRYPIYIDTKEFGRICSKQEFTYLQSNANPVHSPASSLFDSPMNESSNKIVTPKIKDPGETGGVFNRTGSQKSSLILVDRRSARRERSKRPEALGKSDSLSNSTVEVSSKLEIVPGDNSDVVYSRNNAIHNSIVNDLNQVSTNNDRESFVSRKGRPTGESELGDSKVTSHDNTPKFVPSFKRSEVTRPPGLSRITTKPTETSSKLNGDNKMSQPVNGMSASKEPMFASRHQPVEDAEFETASAMSGDTSETMGFSEINKPRRGSDRSAASGRSKSIMGTGEDEGLRLENEALRSMLNDANRLITTIKSQTLTLETELNDKVNDIDRLSKELCRLKNRLLMDGLTQYLERV
ncbi:unnamed protein product [Heterobilharzia americana]|nr:unnamed protein product [Heterobilharzia americana]